MEKLLVAELLCLPLWGCRCMDRNKFSVVLISDLLVGVCRGWDNFLRLSTFMKMSSAEVLINGPVLSAKREMWAAELRPQMSTLFMLLLVGKEKSMYSVLVISWWTYQSKLTSILLEWCKLWLSEICPLFFNLISKLLQCLLKTLWCLFSYTRILLKMCCFP